MIPEYISPNPFEPQSTEEWMNMQSALIRMGIIKRRIARSLGLP
jgi:hypothetical protein